MSDIDFDELDKAVNNLVSDNKSNNDSNMFDSDMPVDESEPKQEQKSNQKPKGRFMDVVHHSSEMISKKNLPETQLETQPETSEAAPRKVVSPIYDDIIASPVKNKMYEPPSSKPPQQPDSDLSPKNDWPDPIELAQPKKNDEVVDTTKQSENTTPSPLFLPDTKVEKRPLGGFSDDQVKDKDTKTSEIAPNQEEVAEALDAKPPEETPPPISLPPELEADLVAIEEGASVTGTEAPAANNNQNSSTTQDKKIPEPDFIDKAPQEQPAVPKTHAQKAVEASGLLAAGSIPQQYKSTTASTETPEATHPIFFDADQYDKTSAPSASAQKPGKTSLFQWIFIVVGLLLLGATLGAALFVFVSTN